MSDRLDRSNPTDFPVLDVVRQRWSPVSFDGRDVEEDKLRSMFESARWAASCFNAQPWRFMLARRSDREAFDAILDCLVDANREWAEHAGVLVLVVARQDFEHNGKPNRWAWYDCGQAATQLILEAVHQGLLAHSMAGFDADKARENHGIEEGYDPACVIAVGYPGENEKLSESTRDRDVAPRQRKELADLVFRHRFGEISPTVASPSTST